MTVTEAFTAFKANLELPDRLQDKAAAAQQALRTAISRYLTITDSFLTGSYARYTKIDPLKDIDVILVRNNSPVGVSTDGTGTLPAEALQQLAYAARQACPSAAITTQARSINLAIPGVTFGFDLVPAWHRAPNGFWIPDTDMNQWLPTNPTYHASIMTDANKASGGKLKPLIKTAKHWSRQNYDQLRSFHIELICLNIATKYTLQNAQTNIAGFLEQLPTYVGAKMMDPAYGVSRVDKELSHAQLTELQRSVDDDAARARTALAYEQQGNHAAAIATWKKIFVAGFPQ